MCRRRFVQGIAGGTLLLGAGRVFGRIHSASAQVLSGSQFDLSIDELAVNYTGAMRIATAVNDQLPAPLLRWREGDVVTLRVTNHLRARSSIHWHGMIVPADMDGVPGLSFDGIGPGQTYTYRFPVNQHGTYWYHSHSRFQEQTGLYGPIVIEPRGGERHRCERDYTVILSDWSDVDPEHIYATLKQRQSTTTTTPGSTPLRILLPLSPAGGRARPAQTGACGRVGAWIQPICSMSRGRPIPYLMMNGSTPSGKSGLHCLAAASACACVSSMARR